MATGSDVGALRCYPDALDASRARVAESGIGKAEHASAFASLRKRRGGHLVPRARLLERGLPRRQGHRVGAHGAARYDGARRAVARALDRAERSVQDARHAALVDAVRRPPVGARLVRKPARRCHGYPWLRSRAGPTPSLAAAGAAPLRSVREASGCYKQKIEQ